MSELVAFLEARLAEDEAVARSCVNEEADHFEAKAYGGDWHVLVVGGMHVANLGNTTWHGTDELSAHIARHDPARVLREVTAKRAILAKYQRAQAAYEQMVNPASTAAVFALAEVVQHMAAPFSDHPDFQEQWR